MKKKIIYIAGLGHSGSTLLDTVLGNQKNVFSTGELLFFPEKGIKNKEYCSCGARVPDCKFWSIIISKWDERRRLDLDEFIEVQYNLIDIKNPFFARKLLIKQPEKVKTFLLDLENLYDLIFEVSKAEYFVNSSKSVGYIPVLKELKYDTIVIHLKRRFGDVLNSVKKHREKDIKAGLEHEMRPVSTRKVLKSFIVKNALIKYYSNGLLYEQVKYEDYINDLEQTISKIFDYDSDFYQLLKNRGPFFPQHLVAGNRLRMKDKIFVAEKPMDTSYHRLNTFDKIIAKTIDLFY